MKLKVRGKGELLDGSGGCNRSIVANSFGLDGRAAPAMIGG